MSLFKAKYWWSNAKLQEADTPMGLQNGSCMKVDKFNSHSESDCIVVGEDTLLKIYKPNKEEDTSSTLLEGQMSGFVLQIETGKFTSGSEDRQIIVLHPQSYAVYQLYRKEGLTDAGEQNILRPIIKHSFTRKASSLTIGPFGNIKTRDLICVQALDGSLSFFDQDSFLFMFIFQDVVIPGPMAYNANGDSFIICKSTWVMEIHSYQQLREFSELNASQNKKNIPQWIYNAGEEISAIQVIQTSNNISSIIALGERHLYCFQDNGLMKFMIKFIYTPVCFSAYLIGWYFEPSARLLIMVASDDSKAFVYEGTTLLWSCDLLTPVMSISRCFLKYLPGGIASLSPTGVVTVCYLGTEPDLNTNAGAVVPDNMTGEEVVKELEVVEESLQKIMDGDDAANQYQAIDQILKIKAEAGKPVQNLFQLFDGVEPESLHLLMCPVVIILTCEDTKQIQSIQITYVSSPPFAFTENTVCMEAINGTEIVETQVFISSVADIPDPSLKIMFTVTDSSGKISVLSRSIDLPLSLYCSPYDVNTENETRLQIETNLPCVGFDEIFTDFSKEHLSNLGNSTDIVTFAYRTTKKTVTLKAFTEYYTIEANDIPELAAVLNHFIIKLQDHYSRIGVKEFKWKLKIDEEISKQITHRFLKSVEVHAKERTKLNTCEEELNVLQKQFTLIQKKLLVQYGSLPPGDCESLEYLMRDTHARIVDVVQEIIHCKESVCCAGTTLTSIGHLIVYIIKNTIEDELKVRLIEEMMTLDSLYEHYQEWEEAVTQALFYILNSVYQNSKKDKEKLAPVTEEGVLSNVNLKRFVKQLKIVLDRTLAETIDREEPKKITRIEEFVEVI